MEEQRILAGKEVTVFAALKPHAPLVILHTVHGKGGRVYQLARREAVTDFSLAAIGNIAWEDEMSPWAIPPLSNHGVPCTGGADAYLEQLTDMILPEIVRSLPAAPLFTALAGYSLAGLFAVYALYHTDRFLRVASASGSFWYPGFLDFVQEHKLQVKPERMYFSLGDKEAHTKNRYLRSVRDNTRCLENWYRTLGVQTVYAEETGNHFQQVEERMARGIGWILR